MLPTVEPSAQRAHSGAQAAPPPPLPAAAGAPLQATEILGNTVDPCWRFSAQTVPTRCSLTTPDGLPFGFVIQPFAAPGDSARWLRREAERCQGCGAFRNLYVAVEANTGRWMCNFCGHVTASDDLKGKEAIEACRELRDAVVRPRAHRAPARASAPLCPHAPPGGGARGPCARARLTLRAWCVAGGVRGADPRGDARRGARGRHLRLCH